MVVDRSSIVWPRRREPQRRFRTPGTRAAILDAHAKAMCAMHRFNTYNLRAVKVERMFAQRRNRTHTADLRRRFRIEQVVPELPEARASPNLLDRLFPEVAQRRRPGR